MGCGNSSSAKPGTNNRPGGIESEIVDKPKPPPDNEPEIIKIIKVDLNIAENTKEHHTDEFEIKDKFNDDDNEGFLLVRRGQKFNLKIEFSREYNKLKDELRLVFQYGRAPDPKKGTHVELILSDKDDPEKWGAYIKSNEKKSTNLIVMSPSTCPVGKWRLYIDVVKRDDTGTSVFRNKHIDHLYILFNPWCRDDQVYLQEKGDKLLNEYVLNESGQIYCGSTRRISYRPWTFGQFTGNVLDCILHLLDMSHLKDHMKGDPVQVCRKLSALINSQDDKGVLTGNWSGDYSGGTSPSFWTGSVAILEEYYEKKRPVKFGQCWVFSGLLTTACRALGIPARSVTNFSSAHDTDGSVTIDKHFDADGSPLDHLDSDSVWNFHVWNDVWMARPDLPSGFGGWQAIDATPQETSDGVYCMGPMSLLGIKRGEVILPFDGPFVFAEVNADRVYWVYENGNKTPVHIDKHAIGKYISTRQPFTHYGREDITNEYKYPDGSEEERAAVRHANLSYSDGDAVYEPASKDVTFELNSDPDTFIGDTINVTLKITNRSEENRTINGTLLLTSMSYMGIRYADIERNKINNLSLNPKGEKMIKLEVPANDYLSKLTDHCMCKISCMCTVKETRQRLSEIGELRLRKPHLEIKAPKTGTVGREIEIEVSFDNPLSEVLTNCELRVEGAHLQRPTIYKQNNVEKLGRFVGKFTMTPKKRGDREFVVYFNCKQINSVTSSQEIKVQ